jgi:hypothetical protein
MGARAEGEDGFGLSGAGIACPRLQRSYSAEEDMNKKAILGILGAVVVIVVGFFGYKYLQLRAEARKWAGPHKEIISEKVTKDGQVTTTEYVSIVDAPLAAVQKILWEPEDSQKMVENITLSKLIKAEDDTKVVEMNLRALSLPLQYYTMEFTLHPKEHRISFKTVQSQVQDIQGEYILEASPNGKKTQVTYTSKSRDKIVLPFPESVVESANREIFVNTMRGLEKSAQKLAAAG